MESSCSRLASSPGGTLRRLTASVAGEGGRRERSGSGLPHGRIGAGVVPRQPGGNSAPGPRVPGNIKRPAPPHPPALPCVCGCPCRCHRRVPGRLAPSGVPSIAREGSLLRLRHERIAPADADSERLGGLPDRECLPPASRSGSPFAPRSCWRCSRGCFERPVPTSWRRQLKAG